MVSENPTPYGILALWAVNGLSIVYWDVLVNRCMPSPITLYLGSVHEGDYIEEGSHDQCIKNNKAIKQRL